MSGRYRYLARTVVEESKALLRHKKMVLAVVLGIPLVYPLLISYLYQRAAVVERPALLVDLDNERKAAMISNLLVVLCGDSRPQPVLNAGSIYQ